MTTNPAENPVPPQSESGQSVPPPVAGPAPVAEVSKDDKNMAMLAHLLSVFFSFIPPLVIWLTKKDTSTFVEDQSREALNWEITVAIAWFALGILAAIPLVNCVMFLAIPGVWVANAVFCIKGATAASSGVAYRYPDFGLRLVK